MVKRAWHALFGAMANPARMEILDFLRTGEKNVTEIVEFTGLSQSLVSHNLRRLVSAQLVVVRADGVYRRYALNAKLAEPLFQQMDLLSNESSRKIRERLKMTEGRFNEILAHAPSYVFIVDPTFKMTYLNRAAPGRSTEEFVGKNIVDLQPNPERKKMMVTAFKKAMRTDTWVSYETKSMDGAHWYISWIGTVRQEGKVQDIVVIVTDITDLKKEQAAHAQAAKRLQLIFENAPNYIILIDPKTLHITSVNRHMLGTAPKDIIGHSILTFLSEKERVKVKALMHKLIRTGEPVNHDLEVNLPGVGKRWFTNRVSRLVIDDEVKELVMISTDITPWKI